MSKLHRDTDTAVRLEAKRAGSELTRCGWGDSTWIGSKHSNPQSVPLSPDHRHSGEPQLWNNSQEEVNFLFFIFF